MKNLTGITVLFFFIAFSVTTHSTLIGALYEHCRKTIEIAVPIGSQFFLRHGDINCNIIFGFSIYYSTVSHFMLI